MRGAMLRVFILALAPAAFSMPARVNKLVPMVTINQWSPSTSGHHTFNMRKPVR